MFKVWRRAQRQAPNARKKLRPLRKGVADIPLRAQVSQEVNDRFMEELAAFSNKTPLSDLLAPHVRSHTQDGRRVRTSCFEGQVAHFLHLNVFLVAHLSSHLLGYA